jgi:hypothetical protein
MKVFLRRLMLFTAVLTVVAVGLDSVLKAGLRQRRTFTLGVWNRLVDGRIQADVLFCGSSRAFIHFDAAAIGQRLGVSAWNIGMDGNQLNHQLPWLITYLRYNRPPKLVVQNVDMISLVPDSDIFFPSQYPPYLHEPPIYADLVHIDPDWRKDRFTPLYSFTRFGYTYAGLAIEGLLGLEDTVHDPLDHGFQRKDKTWDGTFDRFKAQHPDGVRRRNTPAAQAILRAIIRTAKEAGSRVVLVYTPEHRDMQELTLDRAALIDTFRRIAQEEGVPFWDFSVLPLCDDRGLFYNSQHLNGRGVDQFTPMIADSIQALMREPLSPGPDRTVP